jgi:hypothetical protein
MPAPLIDGPALREVTVRDYRRNAERAGLPIDMAEIERLALSDCNTYAAVMRTREPSAPAAPDPAKAAERAGALDESAAAHGAKVLRAPAKVATHKLLDAVPKPTERWAWALGRKAKICAGANYAAWAPPGSTPREIKRAMFATCEIPALAEAFDDLHAKWTIYTATGGRCHKGAIVHGVRLADENPFAGLSVKDALRKYQRLTEDLCDQSSSKLGPWWVPK